MISQYLKIASKVNTSSKRLTSLPFRQIFSKKYMIDQHLEKEGDSQTLYKYEKEYFAEDPTI